MGISLTDKNMQQIVAQQSDWYEKRKGTVYGDFCVVDVWYDWEARKQMWKLQCTRCARVKITHNGKQYAQGKNKGTCVCRKNRCADAEEKIKANNSEGKNIDDLRIDQIIGNWRVVERTPQKGWLFECQKCGRMQYHYLNRIESEKQPLCTCEMSGENWSDPSWIGKRFGHLVIQKHGGHGTLICKCDCGTIKRVAGAHLLKARQKTCGSNCAYHEVGTKTHGLSGDRLYRIWSGMRQRCYNPNSHSYKIYGGRGITICEEWKDDVFAFREWALSNGYADDLSIDRIDCDKGYSPENCRWATAKEQANNQHPRYTFTDKKNSIEKRKRKTWVIDGEEKSIQEWCRDSGLSVQAVMYRVNTKGMTPKEALATPKQQGVNLF